MHAADDNPQEPLSILVLNQDWFVDELRALGHKVVAAGWSKKKLDIKAECPGRSIQELFAQLPSGFEPDRIIYFDDSGPVGILDFENLSIPTVFYSVDAHHHCDWHKCFGAAFDHVLVAQREFLSSFLEFNPHSSWFPLWAPFEVEPSAERSIDVSFRGNLDPKLHPLRAKFFEKLAEQFSVDAKTGPWPEVYSSSKIVVNQAVKDDLNFRVFEAMTCGALLVTPRQENGLEELFTPGVHLITYEDGNADDAASKIAYYLEHEEEREAIARAGRAEVLTNHSKLVRAKQLEQLLYEIDCNTRPAPNFGMAVACLFSSRRTRSMSDEVSNLLLTRAVEDLILSAEFSERDDDAYTSVVLHAKFMLEELNELAVAETLLNEVCARMPEQQLLQLGKIDSLLRMERYEDAISCANAISTTPEALVEQAPAVLSDLRALLTAQTSS